VENSHGPVDSNGATHCGCQDTPKIQVGVPDTHFLVYLVIMVSKLHNCCIRVISLPLEIRDIGIQVVFELLIIFLRVFFTSECAETVWRTGSALPHTPSWLQARRDPRKKGKEGRGGR